MSPLNHWTSTKDFAERKDSPALKKIMEISVLHRPAAWPDKTTGGSSHSLASCIFVNCPLLTIIYSIPNDKTLYVLEG